VPDYHNHRPNAQCMSPPCTQLQGKRCYRVTALHRAHHTKDANESTEVRKRPAAASAVVGGGTASPQRFTKKQSRRQGTSSSDQASGNAVEPTANVVGSSQLEARKNAAAQQPQSRDEHPSPSSSSSTTSLEQLRTALVHLTKRTTSLATDIGDLRQLVTEANSSSRFAVMSTNASKGSIDEINTVVQRLGALLEQCERSASQSALRWERLDVVGSVGGTDGGAANVVDAAAGSVPRETATTTLSAGGRPSAAALVNQQTMKVVDAQPTTLLSAPSVAATVLPSIDAATQQLLLARVEMLASTVASLVQQRQQESHSTSKDRAYPCDATSTSTTLVPSSVAPISATLCPITHLLTVTGSQVVVSNIPALVSAGAIRTWCYTVAPVLSIIVLPPSRKGRRQSTPHQPPQTQSNSSSHNGGGDSSDVKSMLVTFASVEDANRAVQRLNGYAWAASHAHAAPGQKQSLPQGGHHDKTFFARQHYVLSVTLYQQHDPAAAAALVYLPLVTSSLPAVRQPSPSPPSETTSKADV
jgi:hypothetical protein